MAANASVASARYRPWSRIAGNANSAPTGIVTRAARKMAQTLPCAPPRRVYATAPIPAKASGASETCPAQPVSGTSDNARSAVHIPSAKRLVLVGSLLDRNRVRIAMNARNAVIPIAVSRTDETCSTRRICPIRANWTSARGSNSRTTKSMMVGNASGTFVQRSENLRNDAIHCVPSARMIAPR